MAVLERERGQRIEQGAGEATLLAGEGDAGLLPGRAGRGASRAAGCGHTASVLRPHLAVHRALSPGLLALLADAPTDGLAALAIR